MLVMTGNRGAGFSGFSCSIAGIKYAHIPQPFGWVPCKIRVSGQGMWRINPESQQRQINDFWPLGFCYMKDSNNA